MNGAVVVDTNLLVLLTVGSASINYIAKHKRLSEFSSDDFQLVVELIGLFSDLILLPHILAETSNLITQIPPPARTKVQDAFRTLVTTTAELPLPSIHGVARDEFHSFGLTDAMLLHLCSLNQSGVAVTLLTSDTALADAALSRGYSAIDYRREYQGIS